MFFPHFLKLFLNEPFLLTGKGAGSLIGGYLMKGFGTKITYQLFAASMVLTGCMYYVFNKVYIEPIYRLASDTKDVDCSKKKVRCVLFIH